MGMDGEVEPVHTTASAPEEGDGQAGVEDEASGFDRWRTQSSTGAIGTGIARGLQAVFAPPVHEIAIVAEVPGEPPDADQRVRVILDPDDPTKSLAIIPEASPAPDERTDFSPRSPSPPAGG